MGFGIVEVKGAFCKIWASFVAEIVTKIGSLEFDVMVFVGPEPSKSHGSRGLWARNFREDVVRLPSPFFTIAVQPAMRN